MSDNNVTFYIHQCPCRTLHELYTFRPFTERLPPGSGSLKKMLETCITVAVPVWFSAQEAQMQPQVQVSWTQCYVLCILYFMSETHHFLKFFSNFQTEKGRLIAFRDLSQFCLQQCQISLKTLKPIFAEWVATLISIETTKILCGRLKTVQ